MNRGTGFLRGRPVLGTELVILLASLAFAAFYNRALWGLLAGGLDPAAPRSLLLLGSLFVAVVCLQFAGLALLLPRPALKPVLVVLFFCTAFASLYMDRYAIFLNQDMIRNILKTDVAEASELLNLTLLPHVLLYAVLPSALVLWVRLRPRPLGRAVLVRSGAVLAAVA
ncbi:MAG: DUF1705 domain-containing protein, partial [Gammaproteobacteria bacterium]|nr:DUF1705 domain-containing protein [Gammaproteobacteria bacterium]